MLTAGVRRAAAIICLAVLAGACSAGSPRGPVPPPAAARPRLRHTSARYARLPRVLVHGSRSRRIVAITFDSNMTWGMLARLRSGRATSYDDTRVLAELDRLHVPATFFLSSLWVLRYPGTTRRIGTDPLFEVGSHSYAHAAFRAHCYGLATLRPGQMAADVRRSFAVLRRYVAHPQPYFRFPGGCYDRTSLRALGGLPVVPVQFDVASGDAFGRSVRAIVRHTLATAQAGSIIVMHVTLANAPLTAAALPAIVAGLRREGLTPVRLSTLIAAGGLSYGPDCGPSPCVEGHRP